MVNNNGGGHLLDTGQPLEVLCVLSCVEHFPCLICPPPCGMDTPIILLNPHNDCVKSLAIFVMDLQVKKGRLL